MHPVAQSILEVLQLLGFLLYTQFRAIFLTFIPAKWRYKSVTGQVCLITGGGAGIGLQMAKIFSKHGCKMVLVDINKDALEQAVEQCQKCGAQAVYVYVCDISDRQKIYDMTEKIKADVGPVDILINNAGIVSGKPLLELDDAANIERTFKIDVLAHFWLIKAFLPDMLHRQNGHIVTIASMAGILCASSQLMDYASAKYAAVGLAETLEYELRAVYKTNAVKQTLVCPYFIATGMFHGISLKYEWLLPYMTPEYVAQKTVDGVLTNRSMVCLPPWLYILACMKYFLPVSFRLRIAEFLGTAGSMSSFEGHKNK